MGNGELDGLGLVLALDQRLCDFLKCLNLSVSFFLSFFFPSVESKALTR